MIFCFDNQAAKLCKNMKFLVLVAAIVACVHCVRPPPPLREFHRDLPPKDLNHYFGVQAKQNVPDYELVHLKKSKPRRSATEEKEPLQYDFSAFGENYSLDLEHNDKLIAPGCLVHYFQSNGTKKVRPCPARNDDCYYYGTSSNHNDSRVAISTCSGVMGMVRLPDRDYDLWIQPVLKKHHNRARRSVNSAEPHIVVKRPTLGPNGAPAEVSSLVSDVRRRRDADDRYAEMLLVADKTMFEAHGDDLRNFLLAVANVASRILADQSIGTPIHLSVVKINILEDDEPGLTIVDDVTETLQSFCTWQERFNVKDDNNPQHYDGAALFTRLDIIFNGVRDTTGYATVAGMCGDKKRCSYNQDTGLNTGVTLAHETGHTLGMVHDGADNSCPDKTNVMSSGGMGGKTALFWSECSRKALHDFLAMPAADCLKDVPQNVIALPKELPGVLYDGDEQCRMFAGEGSTICTGTNRITQSGGDECERLFCFDPDSPGSCIGDSVPRMDGTMCGDRKYCMRGQCVDIGPDGPSAVDGGWSDFDQEWSPCSRSCGGGVRVKTRRCNNPKPQLGGKPCPGLKVMSELCNMQPCSTSQEMYRNEQCALTDSDPLNGHSYHWVPISDSGSQQCELHCKADKEGYIYLRQLDKKNSYKDGTICSAANASLSRCVDGICLSFGCDGKSGSSYQFDVCGVCGGNGETCSKITGKYSQGEKEQYVTFVTIPEKATSIFITNTNPFTQMTIKIGNNRIFNKVGTMQDRPGRYSLDGVTVVYSLSPESIKIEGPLPLPIEAQVWRRFTDNEVMNAAPVITYEYHVPSTSGPSEYVWQATNGVCSKKCGGGVYNRLITCTRRAGGAVVDDHFCNVNEKPSITGDACNNQACPPIWKAGRYSTCSKTCGGGSQTRQLRCVRDMDGTEVEVDASSCPADQRPVDTRQCNEDVTCPPAWSPGAWSACSLTCGKGVQTRTITCVKDTTSNEPVSDSLCDASAKPSEQQSCVLAVCHPEITGDACKDTTSCNKYGPTMCKDYQSFAEKSCMKTCAFCTPEGFVACEDKNNDCQGYGTSICTGTYKEWAEDNCPKTCGICGGGSGPAAACEDKSTDCQGYGLSICTGAYQDWAKETCPKMCGFCTGGSEAAATSPAATNPAVSESGSACEDKSADCLSYGKTVCIGAYQDWAKENCPKMCGFCTGGSEAAVTSPAATNPAVSESGSACEDKSADCLSYGKTVCIGAYQDWAKENCPKMCGFCTGGSEAAVTSPAATNPAVSESGSACEDKSADCLSYGKTVCIGAYQDWAKENCPKMCGFCTGGSEAAVTSPAATNPAVSESGSACEDTNTQCKDYGTTICTNEYAEWAKLNCPKMCGFCSARNVGSTAPVTQQVTTPTTTTSTTTPSTTPTTSTMTTTAMHTTATPIPTTTTSATTTSTPPATTITAVVQASACQDKDSSCATYGISFCAQTQYAAFAKENCARYCKLCPDMAGQAVECKDAVDNCPLYGESVCSNADYAEWVQINCARFCKLCGGADTTTPTATTTAPLTTTQQQVKSDCRDQTDVCPQYTSIICNDTRYTAWVQENCARFCNLCQSDATTTTTTTMVRSEECKDQLSNCNQYDPTVCTNPDYKDWARTNCAFFCTMCDEITSSALPTKTTTTATTTKVMTTSTATTTTTRNQAVDTDKSCKDQLVDCANYGKSICTNYTLWAKSNCAKFCDLCDETSGAGQDCKDTLTNCAQYDASYCKKEEYKPWAVSNCARFCGFCDVTTTTAASNVDCSDVLTNCAQYDASTCTSDIYRSWAESNCAKTCKLCSSATAHDAMGLATATPAADGCKDTLSNCAGYGLSVCSEAAYTQWVADNCRAFCGLCGGSAGGRSAGSGSGNGAGGDLNGNGNGIGNGNGNGSPTSGSIVGDDACQDVFNNCPGYGLNMCTDYADWALQNCRKYCNKCAARRRRSVLMPPSPRPLCNKVLTAHQGSLALIGHPLDRSCDHVIVAPIGSSVHLSFNAVLVSCEEGDWLEVQEEGGSVKKGKSRHDMCNAGRPREWTTRGNVVTIRMSVARPGHGYNMTYKVLQAPPRPGCDRLLTNPTGILSSPGFPEKYPSNKLCVTTIVAPPGYSVRLSFSFLQLESDDCSKDSVTLLDQEKGIKDVFCGVQTSLLWESKSNKIKVFFASDNQNSAKGFLASYKFIVPW